MVNLYGKRRSTKDDVIDYLLDCVLEKKLIPGEKIVETQVAREMGLSQGVIREAFRDLSFMGFLISEPYKGTHLRSFSDRDREDYYEVRTFLERTAIDWAFSKGLLEGKDVFDPISENARQIISFAEEGNHRDQIFSDLNFHKNLVALSGSSSLVRSWEALGNLYWFFIHYFSSMDMLAEGKKHVFLLDALKEGNYEKANYLLNIHFDQNRKWYPSGATRLEDRH